MDEVILALLANGQPEIAADFLLRWSEERSSSWADAARDAKRKAASSGHTPQIRGQLRYHYGERALADAAKGAGVGCMPLASPRPGGSLMIARVGKFAIASLKVRKPIALPRASTTRALLSQPNEAIDPQDSLFDTPETERRITELAYFGCVVSVPCKADPTVPAELAFGVMSADMKRWISWISLPRACALLQDIPRVPVSPKSPQTEIIPDRAFPKLRVPKLDPTGDGGDQG